MYWSESAKIRPKIEKYLKGSVLDIGCNIEKITPDAWAVDARKTDVVDQVVPIDVPLSSVIKKKFDVVFSSHCLEHIKEDVAAVKDWSSLVEQNGYLILYLPDSNFYTQENPEHLHSYQYELFLRKFKSIHTFKVIDSGLDVGEDRYSFYLVAQNI